MPRADANERTLAELHRGGFGDFAARRDALARALRERGDAEGAKRMKGERKPSISAWSVTQLFAEHEDEVSALLGAGERARQALAAVLGGEAPARLREKMDELQARIDAARALAERHLADETGRAPSDVVLGRVADDLRALALAPDGAERVARGFLPDDLAPPGLELWSTMPAPPKRAPSRIAARDTSAAAERERREEEKARRATADRERRQEKARRTTADRERRQEKARRTTADRERREEEKRRGERERARRAAREQADALAREAERAEREARDARERVDALAREAERAEREARDARKRADAAQRALGRDA